MKDLWPFAIMIIVSSSCNDNYTCVNSTFNLSRVWIVFWWPIPIFTSR